MFENHSKKNINFAFIFKEGLNLNFWVKIQMRHLWRFSNTVVNKKVFLLSKVHGDLPLNSGYFFWKKKGNFMDANLTLAREQSRQFSAQPKLWKNVAHIAAWLLCWHAYASTFMAKYDLSVLMYEHCSSSEALNCITA